MYVITKGEAEISSLSETGGISAADFGGYTGAFYPEHGCPPCSSFEEKEFTVYFGGSYWENWSEDYVLTISYENRRAVRAVFRDGCWRASGGDEQLCRLINSDKCPRLTRQYFQAAASAAAAAEDCLSRGMELQRVDECISYTQNPLAAPELMRLLMDDYGLKMYDAYDAAARCCDLSLRGINQNELYALQPRTVHVVYLLENCRENTLALLHDSRLFQYRSPFGALPCGDKLRLAFRVLGGKPEHAELVLYSDDSRRELPMEREGDMYSVSLNAPEKPAAMWYSFKISDQNSVKWLCPDGSGYFGRLFDTEYGGFRLTVYKKDFATPDWVKGRIMYQIFPDRFAFSDDGRAREGIAYHRALGQFAELHESTDEPPRYKARAFEESYSPDDFYGGTIKGIISKLPYIKSLGAGVIYLNPVFEARSNHRYDTSDYKKIDPILGTNEDFEELCRRAAELDIRIIADGVFSHTGADSVYFNRYGNYNVLGACQGRGSEFFSWYDFRHFPDEYRCWWGFKDLPEVEERNLDWQEYIIKGRDSVIKHWLREGISGWRLDVADELPDEALALIRQSAKEEKTDAFILGEVWEDAVIKESYGGRRNYALGYSLDSVMNYPLRAAVLDFVHGRRDAFSLRDFLIGQHMNYPAPMYHCLMNLLGSHDVVRLRSAIALDAPYRSLSREQQLELKFDDKALYDALNIEKLCSAIQYAIPGSPSLYYGDEQGMCGVSDPFNRQCFKESGCGLYEWYKRLALFRNENPAMTLGEVQFMAPSEDILIIMRFNPMGRDAFGRRSSTNVCLCVVNRSKTPLDYEADCSYANMGIYKGRAEAESAMLIKLI